MDENIITITIQLQEMSERVQINEIRPLLSLKVGHGYQSLVHGAFSLPLAVRWKVQMSKPWQHLRMSTMVMMMAPPLVCHEVMMG